MKVQLINLSESLFVGCNPWDPKQRDRLDVIFTYVQQVAYTYPYPIYPEQMPFY
jgi:hypothetical protein